MGVTVGRRYVCSDRGAARVDHPHQGPPGYPLVARGAISSPGACSLLISFSGLLQWLGRAQAKVPACQWLQSSGPSGCFEAGATRRAATTTSRRGETENDGVCEVASRT